jgi:two-component system, NarL family, response regulator DegU
MKRLTDAPRKTIRVLVADSNQTQSQLLSSALRRQPGFRVTCCRAELSECLKALETASADIALVGDGVSHNGQPYAALRALHAAHPQVVLILLVDSYDRDSVVNAMRSGVSGLFCRASQPFKALCRCIYAVHEGQVWVNTEQLRYLIDALTTAPPTRVINAKGEELLTLREEQIVAPVAEGMSNREIAEQLNIKENTVKKALLRIYEKLGVSNRVELVLYALAHREDYKSRGLPFARDSGSKRAIDSARSSAVPAGTVSYGPSTEAN